MKISEKTQFEKENVFGGKHTWHLQQTIRLIHKSGHWLMTEAIASTY